MTALTNFILIDDSPFDLYVYEKLLVKCGLAKSLRKFQSASEAINWIKAENPIAEKTVILLDLQMPVMTGFEFVDAFQDLNVSISNNYSIFMLSSTIDSRDIERVRRTPLILDLLSKPLDIEILKIKLKEIHNSH